MLDERQKSPAMEESLCAPPLEGRAPGESLMRPLVGEAATVKHRALQRLHRSLGSRALFPVNLGR